MSDDNYERLPESPESLMKQRRLQVVDAGIAGVQNAPDIAEGTPGVAAHIGRAVEAHFSPYPHIPTEATEEIDDYQKAA